MGAQKKEPWLYQSKNLIRCYIFIYMLVTLVQSLPFIFTGFNENFSLPMNVWATGLVAVTSAYIGLDRLALVTKTATLERNQGDMGDPSKLRTVIYWNGLVVAETYLLAFLFKVELPMELVTSALVSCLTLYVAGNKGVRIMESVSGKENNTEKNENLS